MTILDKAFDLREETIARRRDFHQNPELAFNEVRTAQIVAQELRDLGLEVTTGVAKTGVIGLLHGAAETPVLGLRFDMDALPIQEETGAPYASVVPGKMHACGHDCHTAVGLSVAKLLAAQKDELQGTIKFIFQPAEEMDGGAARMIAEGVLENPSLDYIMGFHVWNELPIGSYGLVPGPLMAASEIFNVKISGKGGHGAQPHATRDPILAAAHVITALQSIVSRNVDPLDTAVVSVCQVEAGTANNIIPQEALLTGTLRAFKPEVMAIVKERFRTIITEIAGTMGCQTEIELITVTEPVINDEALVALMTEITLEIHPDATIVTNMQTMGGEDFSLMMKKAPGCFMMVGSANPERGLNYGHHHPKFDVDESCLPYAVAIMAQGAMRVLERHPG
ncbi:MAG: putative hydrolase YxeP [Chloroflexi bacterium ADurb.Bin120]|jgi:amidohydrolase|uniref:IAA-amino acid hydrolase ILR1-like 4 n=1 Tax=Candidatus Brevifilum fermentans TaxID=1986204 RepID=A0A1Y6K3G9_9CHLR|nr:M20 family metallopeptidase [Brevefilum fermentans]OQB87892.1 MAG: putative hydrolase YxeP [Chloroflexi bacterium ADurb.Bin120]SMX54106.1 IAA-amino acid hydrolase ILR1-like 4 [Brevefilum fermentans]HOM67703.1 M20 family metallopeptidase [Brevefilum fermentans]